MASITIRNFDDSIKARLRVRAASHGRSMEDEARNILRAALCQEQAAGQSLVDRIRERFSSLGEIELPQPERSPIRQPPQLLD